MFLLKFSKESKAIVFMPSYNVKINSILSRYWADYLTPWTDSSKYRADYSTPWTDLFRYRADYSTPWTDLSRCRADYSTPWTDLSRCRADYSTLWTALSRYRADYSTLWTDCRFLFEIPLTYFVLQFLLLQGVTRNITVGE